MSLTDIDKNNADRGTPKPNSHDQLPPDVVMAKNTVSTSYQTPGTDQTTRIQLLNKQLLSFQSGVPQILIGPDSTGAQVMKVAQAGTDVRTATDSQLIFNSNQDIFKIIRVISLPLQTVQAPTPANQTFQSYTPHGLDYIPAYLAYLSFDPVFVADLGVNNQMAPVMLTTTPSTGYPGIFLNASVWPDATNMYFDMLLNAGVVGAATYNHTATIYLLQETF